jgi:cardiolipin synthase A/B
VNPRHRRLLLIVAATVVASCVVFRSLPKPPVHTAAAAGAAPLSMIGPDGRVNQATRERVTRRLLAIGEDNLLERHLIAMEEAISAPLIAGNSVRLLVDGPATYKAMFAALEGARESVNVEMFIFDEASQAGRNLSDLLVETARRGVAINVLYDSLGSGSTPDSMLEKLRTGGIRLCEFNPVNPTRTRTMKFWQRDHRKIVVVDAQRAFAGGINLSSSYSSGSRAMRLRRAQPSQVKLEGWRDTQIAVEGPVVLELQRLFLESWSKQKCPQSQDANYLPSPHAAGSTLLRVNATSTDSLRNETYISALSAVTFSRKSIDLTMAYFAPDDQLETALIDAARRGVRVRLLLPGITDFRGVKAAGQSHYTRLLEAGILIFEERGALLHAKTLEVDGIWSTIGSANWDWLSFANNDELNIVVIDLGFAEQMRTLFEADLQTATPIRLEVWKRRPLRDRVLEQFWVTWDRFL